MFKVVLKITTAVRSFDIDTPPRTTGSNERTIWQTSRFNPFVSSLSSPLHVADLASIDVNTRVERTIVRIDIEIELVGFFKSINQIRNEIEPSVALAREDDFESASPDDGGFRFFS